MARDEKRKLNHEEKEKLAFAFSEPEARGGNDMLDGAEAPLDHTNAEDALIRMFELEEKGHLHFEAAPQEAKELDISALRQREENPLEKPVEEQDLASVWKASQKKAATQRLSS